MKTLLDKMETVRRGLGSDKVFDVIGRLFENVSLKSYLDAAIRGEDAADGIEGLLTIEQVRALEAKERGALRDRRRSQSASSGHAGRFGTRTLVGAFAERPKLPKMLRRKDLLDTVSNGCGQGLYVLSLSRPDGSARTLWRSQIDESALTDDALEAVRNSTAVLDGFAPALLAPGKLEGLEWKSGVKVADLVSYFDGYVLTIDHPEEGWTEQRAIPRCPEAKMLEAVFAAVKSGLVWLTSGTASIWGDTPPAGIVSKTAVLRAPPSRSTSHP
jgi:hypothetical protein